ncbi:pickpocket protein 28-like [Coccinella septempunctata]|uniref:pickpocket protein 28-like n=1 Tax=Coccinella septempunctata TaxID=41139 RepID=UPI001D0893C0|nr:pickpocket protein 28-like [Coccinella septempunctata]
MNCSASTSNGEEDNHTDAKAGHKNFKAYIREYCESSSIQGLSYFSNKLSFPEGCWWTIAFILCLSGCSFMIKEIVDKWNNSPVLFSLATMETPIYKVPFPAVTICPETKISRQCVNYSTVLRLRNNGTLDRVPEEEMNYYDHMAPLCRLENHVNSSKDRSLEDFTSFLNECKSVDLRQSFCEYMGRIVNCSRILSPIITDDGLCYSFNMLDVRDIYSDINRMEYYQGHGRRTEWNVEDGYPNNETGNAFPFRTFETGATKSLVVTMLTKKSEVYASCQDFTLQGLKVSIHTPSTIPRPNQVSFPAGFDEIVSVAVNIDMYTTTEEVKTYNPRKRNCFFDNERKLRYFKSYSQSNCDMECWTNYTIQECGCVHFYMPRDENTTICSLSKIQCLHDAEDSYALSTFPTKNRIGEKTRGKLNGNCECLPSCADLSYQAEISKGKWNWQTRQGTHSKYLSEYFGEYHASAVRVFFKTSQFLSTEKSALYGVTSFLSNAGGILGLFLGFSLVSLIEILYFLSIKLIENKRKYGYLLGISE